MNKEKYVTIYEEYSVGTSIDVLEQKKLKEKGELPLGGAICVFDEALDNTVYYKIVEVHYFDSIEVYTKRDGLLAEKNIYRIDDEGNRIFDHVYTSLGYVHQGELISKVNYFYSKNTDFSCVSWNNEEKGYTGKI